MTGRRFYVPKGSIRDGVASLSPEETRHLRRVLRLKAGETVEIFDSEGNGFSGRVEPGGRVARVGSLRPLAPEAPGASVILAAALIKPAKFEWLLEKATELGASEIIPVVTRRSEVRLPEEKIGPRLERWNRIAVEASKQCRRLSAPRIRRPLEFPGLIRSGEFSGFDRVLFYEHAPEPWRPQGPGLRPALLTVGPEGGWEESEVELARASGMSVCRLGPRILRAETAAIAALAILQHQGGIADGPPV